MKSINGCYYCKLGDWKCVCHLALCYLLLFVQPLVFVHPGGGGRKISAVFRSIQYSGLNLGFVCFSLSQRYQKAAEEATAEKKRSVSVLYKCLFPWKSTAWNQVGSPALILLWQLTFGISKLLLCILQKTWLRRSLCFCFMLFPSVEERKWSFLPKAVLNHQFSPKQKAKWVNHKPGIPTSCS